MSSNLLRYLSCYLAYKKYYFRIVSAFSFIYTFVSLLSLFLFSLHLLVTLFIPLDLKQKALLSLLQRYLFLSVSYLYVALMFSFYSVFA